MKNAISLLALLLLCFSCKLHKKPEFLRVENIEVVKANLKNVELKANAIFKNPNSLGGKLWTNDIKVFIDEKYIGTVTAEEFKVPAKKDFSIPLTVKFSASKIIKNNKGNLLSAILKQVLEKKVVVNFKGDLGYKVIGFTSNYAIDYTEEIVIK